jgi:glycosyltransferase involved in cell wall biosynthesis
MTSPRVSIGVPVYNGQKYIRYALDSLLAQTFGDLEIIVTDNCSTDPTPQIVQECAARDPRVIYVRNETNVGPALNYNRSIARARGEFFRWNNADDMVAPTFVQKCLDVLESDPTVILAYPRTMIIDSEGNQREPYGYEVDFDQPQAHARLWKIMTVNHKLHGAHEMFGLMRTAQLRKTSLWRAHVRGDSVMLARLLLLGRFRRIDEYLFFNRDHTDRSSKYLSRTLVRKGSRLSKYLGFGPLPSAEWWDPKLKGKIVFPEWRVLREYLRAVQEAELSAAEKAACYRTVMRFAIRHSPKMARDLIIATEQCFNSLLGLSEEDPPPLNRASPEVTK